MAKKTKEPKEGVDFELYGLPNDNEVTVVRIKKGRFKGVTYYYTDIRLVENIVEGQTEARLGFELQYLSGEYQDRLALSENPQFIKQAGDILASMLYAAIVDKDEKVEVRVGRAEESDSE